MATDKGSTGTTPEVETDPKKILQQQIIQAKNAQALADEKYKKDPSAENGVARLEAMAGVYDLYLKQAEMDGNTDVINLITKLRPDLMKLVRDARVNLADQAGKHNLDLQKELSVKQRDLLDKQSKDLFDLDVMGQKTTVSLLAVAKGFAALLKSFGIDTTQFMAECDEGMKQARASIAEVDYKTLSKPSIAIDPSAGQRQLGQAEISTTKDLQEQVDRLRSKQTELEGARVTPSVRTADAVAVVGASGLDEKTIQKAKIAIEQSSQGDKDTRTLSDAELLKLNKQMLIITGSPEATEKIMKGIRQTVKGPIEALAAAGPA